MALTYIEIFLRSTVIYILILLGIRLSGKRHVGQMSPFDLVFMMLIANAVQNAMTGPDVTLGGGIVAAATLLIWNGLFTMLAWRNRFFRKWTEGTPTVLVNRGTVVQDHLDAEKITVPELHQALREHDVATIEDVRLAVLEVDGTISVLKNDEFHNGGKPHHRIRFLRR